MKVKNYKYYQVELLNATTEGTWVKIQPIINNTEFQYRARFIKVLNEMYNQYKPEGIIDSEKTLDFVKLKVNNASVIRDYMTKLDELYKVYYQQVYEPQIHLQKLAENLI